jgi:hypothetical protein
MASAQLLHAKRPRSASSPKRGRSRLAMGICTDQRSAAVPAAMAQLFEITPSGVLTSISDVCSQSGRPNGNYLCAGLIQASDGNLYRIMDVGGQRRAICKLGCRTPRQAAWAMMKSQPAQYRSHSGARSRLFAFDVNTLVCPVDPRSLSTVCNINVQLLLCGGPYRTSAGLGPPHPCDGKEGRGQSWWTVPSPNRDRAR